jgi:conjugal transfer pilus assembly protein TraE
MRESRYRSVLAQALWRRNLWMAVAAVMALSNMGLVAWIHRVDVREKTIIAPPTVDKAFWVHGDEVSPAYLEQMALFFASLALTYHPDNIDAQVRLFLRYADPQVYGALATRLEADTERVRRNRLSSVFYAQEVRIQGHEVRLTGQLTTWVGEKPVKTRQAAFRFRFDYRNARLFVSEFEEVDRAQGAAHRASAEP